MTDRKLILHIGSHKTGTTTIQKQLVADRNKLEQVGWTLFDQHSEIKGKRVSVGNANSWVEYEGQRDEFKAKLNELFFHELKNTKGDIIISSEEMSWFHDRNDWQYIYNKLKEIFSDIKVVVYFRRQDKQVQSHYQQGFRVKESTAAMFYGRELRAIPKYEMYFDRYLDYYYRYTELVQVFGGSSVMARWFEVSLLYENDIVKDFYNIIGLNIELNSRSEVKNVRLNKYQILLSYLVFKYNINPRVGYYLRDRIRSNKYLKPSDIDCDFYFSKYKESNEALSCIMNLKLPKH